MNSRERFLSALELKTPDMVPLYEDYINKRVINAIEGSDTSLEDFVEKWDMDAIVVYGNYKKEFIDNFTFIDELGVTRKIIMDEYPIVIDNPIKKRNDFINYDFPNPDSKHIYKDLIRVVKRFKGKKAIIFRINDVFTFPRDLRGFENFMMDTLDDQMFIKKIINKSVEYNVQLAKNASKYGADAVLSTDDYCDNQGPLISPYLFNVIFFPRLKKIVDSVTKLGLYFIKHSDGNILPVPGVLSRIF